MKIYSMTATFGKLNNQTLTLQPGLNVIHAPNEWGKSTWCAFLANMLYGLETRVKTTKAAIADKERYAPWSGSPMSGRIDLNWNGRDITIERWTKGRTPMGEFKAYETASGLPVTELTATTCGEQLLGVERSVFLRAGFLRLADLPVTEDESLRRRLNALVTTGDESDSGDVLAQKLKELKNKIRYNRSGLLPQAEAEREELEQKLTQLRSMQQQCQELQQRQETLAAQISLLENHAQALEYAAEEERNQRIAQAMLRRDTAKEQLTQCEKACAGLPAEAEATKAMERLQTLHRQSMELDLQQQMLPTAPQKPETPARYQGMTGQAAMEIAAADWAQYEKLEAAKKQFSKITTLGGVLGIALGLVMLLCAVLLKLPQLTDGLLLWGGALLAAAGVAVLVTGAILSKERQKKIEVLFDRYPNLPANLWRQDAKAYGDRMDAYAAAMAEHEEKLAALCQKRMSFAEQIQELTQGQPISSCLQKWEEVSRKWTELENARRAFAAASDHAETLSAMAKPVSKPEMPDEMTLSSQQTQQMLEQAQTELRLLRQRFDQYQGRMESMGQEAQLQEKLDAVVGRIAKLTEYYAALELAQGTLAAATAELQRRFAPRISQRAQTFFERLTGGRYDRLTMAQDLSLSAGTGEESVLRTAQWRSEGTADQMYLALRLAVAGELTAHAPMILDDALVRFDDVRHEAAMKILKEEAERRQIILFTCQSREEVYM